MNPLKNGQPPIIEVRARKAIAYLKAHGVVARADLSKYLGIGERQTETLISYVRNSGVDVWGITKPPSWELAGETAEL